MRYPRKNASESLLAPDDGLYDPGPEAKYSILLVIAGRTQGESLRYQLVYQGFDVDLARSVSIGLQRTTGSPYDAVVVDWQTLEVEYPRPSRVEAWMRLVRESRAGGKPVGVVALLATEPAPPEVEEAGAIAIARGAASNPQSLAEAIERAIERRMREAPPPPVPDELAGPQEAVEDFLFGASEPIRRVFDQVRLVAGRDTTVLITGETGTGKERVSRAIHRLSGRRKMEMVSINCGGIPATLLEDELFGHVKGAFTDARQARIGRFEQANGSTIFLDEIGDLPLELQPKLLRVLQEREIHRIGGVESVQLDVRVIAATNVDLWRRVEEGRFREDLFYRINVFHIHLPPLRERMDDVRLFVRYFLDKLCRRDGLPPKRIKSSAEAELVKRPWRGNIRELENAMEIAVIRSQDRAELIEPDFPPARESVSGNGDWPPPAPLTSGANLDLKALVTRYEQDLIRRTLEFTRGNKNKAAQMLSLKRTTLIEKLKRFEE